MSLGALLSKNEAVFLYGALLAICFLAFRTFNTFGTLSSSKKVGLSLPPGPKPLPLIGNALDMSMTEPWETFTKWAREYGEIVHVSVFGQSIIILNTPTAVSDLFEKRSSIYSDRPRLPLLGELTGFDWAFSFMPYGHLWRKHRRILISKFGHGSVDMFNPAQDFASSRLLELLLERPDEFEDHLRLHMAQEIMMSIYGVVPKTRHDKFVVRAEKALAAISDLFRPGVFLVDAFPILKAIPSWVPGADAQKRAEQLKDDVQNMREAPFIASKEMMASGTLPMPCFVSEILSNEQEMSERFDRDMEDTVRDISTVMFGAGSDTCVAVLSSFILAMSLNPEVQARAQAELDSVIGTSRLATHEDREVLPYVAAVMKEALRWHVVAPQGLPHMLKEDDVYNGYYLPKGAIVVGNSWGILHDPELYPDPMEFKPGRYFDSEGHLNLSNTDPAKFAFGCGRRVCPGLYFAENALHLAISRILATFNISPAKDENGVPVPAVLRATTGIISHPSAFKCLAHRRQLHLFDKQLPTCIRCETSNDDTCLFQSLS